jgi:hypothetical protein
MFVIQGVNDRLTVLGEGQVLRGPPQDRVLNTTHAQSFLSVCLAFLLPFYYVTITVKNRL